MIPKGRGEGWHAGEVEAETGESPGPAFFPYCSAGGTLLARVAA